MSITRPHFVAPTLIVIAGLVVSAPHASEAACYSQPYYQSTYYSQSTYTIQASYATTLTDTTVNALQDFVVSGIVQKGSGTFLIDHPLDPRNSLLYHSFLESPDAKNLYDGIATLDGNGEATITLPDYFEALNKDFRYQLKPIGKPMPDLFVKQEVTKNRFVIGGGVAGGRVSWQVTGIRHDAFIEANPIEVEVDKGPDEWVNRGEFFFVGYESARLPTYSLVAYLRSLLAR